jgi:hypothetical protein
MPSFADALRVINDMKRAGVVEDYAVAHAVIEGVPVQFLPAHNPLDDEAIKRAVTLEYEGVPVRVVRPEFLVAHYLEP